MNFKELLKLARSAAYRREKGLTLLTGRILISEYLEMHKSVPFLFYSLAEGKETEGSPFHESVNAEIKTRLRSFEVKGITDEPAPQGLIAVVPIPKPKFNMANYLLVPHRIRDPRNLGAMIRLASAFGFKVYPVESCDPYGLEVLRCARGMHLSKRDVIIDTRLESYYRIGAELPNKLKTILKPGLVQITKKVPENTPIALVMGGETTGLDNQIAFDAHAMIGTVDGVSLNVSTAAAILMSRLMFSNKSNTP